MPSLLRIGIIVWLSGTIVDGKWVEGRIDTKDNWAFLSRFCFLSLEGQFEYLIEFDRDIGTPNLLLYYDDDSQWPSVYHSSKTCKEREAVLNKAGQNQVISLSHWYPDTEYSGCILTKENKELPATKSTTTPKPTTKNPFATTVKQKNSTKNSNNNNSTNEKPENPSYYDQFLKTTTPRPKSTITDSNSTIWYEVDNTDDLNFTTTGIPEEELWESIGPESNGSLYENLKDVEIMFDNDQNSSSHKIKRSTFELYERFRRRRLNAESSQKELSNAQRGKKERLIVSCHNTRRFRSARERWWFIAISSCDSDKGLDIRYKFLMTNGPDGDFWHEHFSADEFYVLPVLLAYTFAYVIVMILVVMCSVELRSRHLLHATYKLFLISVVVQHSGVMLQCLAYLRYAANGFGGESARIIGQFLSGLSEMTFLLLLILMAKGYTITRGRLKVGFTVKLTVFMCAYCLTYAGLFVYQAKAFDPGEVLYLYESPAGYGLIVLRVTAWTAFALSVFTTVKKYPQKNTFYCPFFICGTLWFHAGPLFILTANSYIDKWVRESVVTAVLLFIAFGGHIMFLILTLPVFANKNFPYHIRTTQIGVMEVTGSSALDGFGHNAYHPGNGAAQTVIIPLTRRTEELIGNMYNQYMAPPVVENTPKLNSMPPNIESVPKNKFLQQNSTETNASDDIKPNLKNDRIAEIFTVEKYSSNLSKPVLLDSDRSVLPDGENLPKIGENIPKLGENSEDLRRDLPSVLRSRRNILEPIKLDSAPVPSWSLAKGPSIVALQKKLNPADLDEPHESSTAQPQTNGTIKKVPSTRNGVQGNPHEISTIHEGYVQSYNGKSIN